MFNGLGSEQTANMWVNNNFVDVWHRSYMHGNNVWLHDVTRVFVTLTPPLPTFPDVGRKDDETLEHYKQGSTNTRWSSCLLDMGILPCHDKAIVRKLHSFGHDTIACAVCSCCPDILRTNVRVTLMHCFLFKHVDRHRLGHLCNNVSDMPQCYTNTDVHFDYWPHSVTVLRLCW